ncbi:MAG UNVERIFIED_CONTAM: hypothetical protein LVR18_00940 [Planctomycetaceae bacterium]
MSPVTVSVILPLAAWIVLMAVLHAVRNAALRFALVAARAVTGLIFWHRLLSLVASMVETSQAWPAWLLVGSAAIASEIILLTYDQSGSAQRLEP